MTTDSPEQTEIREREDCHGRDAEGDAGSPERDVEMSVWTVEIDDDFLKEIRLWPRGLQLELFAIQIRLTDGGPEAMGLVKSELEGVPKWRDLASPYCLPLPVSLPSGWKVLTLEVQPNFRVVIIRLE